MKSKLPAQLDQARTVVGPMATPFGELHGHFVLPNGMTIISSGPPSMDMPPASLWEHVSVSFPHRCPTWEEMALVKRAFWRDDETVVEFHPARSEYVNVHPFCLHLWKPPYRMELPPKITLAPDGMAP